jgi:hypothetical protein
MFVKTPTLNKTLILILYTSVYIFYIKLNAEKITILRIKIQWLI